MVLRPGLMPAPPGFPIPRHPLVFLPFHLGNFLFISRALPHAALKVPFLAVTLAHYAFEHWSHHPQVASYENLYNPVNGVFILALLYLVIASFWKGQTKYAVAGLALFVAQSVIFTMFLQGDAPASVAASAKACADDDYLFWHLMGHLVFWVTLGTLSSTISWAPSTMKKRSD